MKLYKQTEREYIQQDTPYLVERMQWTGNSVARSHSNVGQKLLCESNNTSIDYPLDVCVHQLFEEQVKKTPDAVAIVFVDQQLTYWELNCRANQLAHRLQALGVKPDVLVSLCVERSIEMVVGILGILKAGGAYVPLDPAYPQERLAFILEDTQTQVMLTQEKFVQNLPDLEAQVICLDSDWEAIAELSQENPVSGVTPLHLIYIIYTSGSTGQPKGVMIPHGGICNQLEWRQKTFGITELDKVLQTISFSFDPSVWQIFWPLCHGAELVMARPGGHQDSAYLVKTITEQQITIIALVPSIIRMLLEEKGLENCQSLKHVTAGGEALQIELMERFLNCLKKENVLYNCYGPTEVSIDSTYWMCQRGNEGTTAPIGRPIHNLQTYILDENLQLVPVGESGELHISGAGLARGYLNRPDLSAQKFICNPFSCEPGSRLYKTGDLVRYLPDGNIEFLGRMDHQVKIRGFRIELREIETLLSLHSAVREVVVIAREDQPGDQRLVAYVVLHQEQVTTTDELRRFLKDKLPSYMLPTAIVIIEALPLTNNGKVDRLALPIPEQLRQEPEVTFVAPRNELERAMTQIWSQVLGIQSIGVRDNFFDLGGHSLLAVRLFTQIEKEFGTKIPLASLFTSGTVETLVQLICQPQELANQDLAVVKDSNATWSSLVKIQPNGSKPPLFFLHPLGGEMLCYQKLALHLGSEQPVYGLQPKGLDGKQPPYTQMEQMASHYIQEMRTIQPNGPYFLGGYSFGGIIAFEMAQQLHRLGETVGLLVMIDISLPGCEKRAPFRKRVFLHLNHVLQQGSSYLKQKIVGWREWGTYNLKQRYKRYLSVVHQISDTDEHLKVIDANVKAMDEYVMQVYPGPITLLRTEDQNRDEAVGVEYDPLFGWGDFVAGGIDLHYVPGSHLSVLKEPHVRVVAAKLQTCLTQAMELLQKQGALSRK